MQVGIGIGIDYSQKANKVLVRDSFNRADNAASLGNADTGQTWIASTGVAVGIVSNKASSAGANTGTGMSVVDVGKVNGFRVSADITWTSTATAGLVFRATSSGTTSDLFRYFIRDGNDLCFDRVVANASSRLLQINAGTFVSGNTYKLTVEVTAANVTKLFLGSTLAGTFSTPELITNTRIGLYLLRNTTTVNSVFDNFLLENL